MIPNQSKWNDTKFATAPSELVGWRLDVFANPHLNIYDSKLHKMWMVPVDSSAARIPVPRLAIAFSKRCFVKLNSEAQKKTYGGLNKFVPEFVVHTKILLFQ